jgi:hypothetical protein
LTISELAAALRGATSTLDQAVVAAATAVPLIEHAKAALLAVRRDTDHWYPLELDLALAELSRAGEHIARAQQLITDYLMRL